MKRKINTIRESGHHSFASITLPVEKGVEFVTISGVIVAKAS
jgi:hypothetical protein